MNMWPIRSKGRDALQLARRIHSRQFNCTAATCIKPDLDKPLSAWALRYRTDPEFRERKSIQNRLHYHNNDERRRRTIDRVIHRVAIKSLDEEWLAQHRKRNREYLRKYRQTPVFKESQQRRREYQRAWRLKQKEVKVSASVSGAASAAVAISSSPGNEPKAAAQCNPLLDNPKSPTHQPRMVSGSVTSTSSGKKRHFGTFGKVDFSTRHFSTCAKNPKAGDGEALRQPLSAWQIKYRNDPMFREREKKRYTANYNKNAQYRETHLQQIRESIARKQREDPSFYRKRQKEYRAKRREEDPEWRERVNAYQREWYRAKKYAAAPAATTATGTFPEDEAQSSAQNAARDTKRELSPVENNHNHTRAQHSSSGINILGGKRSFSMFAGTGLMRHFSTSTKACKNLDDVDDGKPLSRQQIRYRTDPEYRENLKRRTLDRYRQLAADKEFHANNRARLAKRFATEEGFREKYNANNRARLAKRFATEEGFREKYLANNRARLAKRFATEEGFREKYLAKNRAAAKEYRRKKREAQALATVASPLKSSGTEEQHNHIENTILSNAHDVNTSSSSFHLRSVPGLSTVNASLGNKRSFSTLHRRCKESSLDSPDLDRARRDALDARKRERYATDAEHRKRCIARSNQRYQTYASYREIRKMVTTERYATYAEFGERRKANARRFQDARKAGVHAQSKPCQSPSGSTQYIARQVEMDEHHVKLVKGNNRIRDTWASDGNATLRHILYKIASQNARSLPRKERNLKWTADYELEWPTHIPHYEQTKVGRLCVSCNYVRFLKLWWIRREDSGAADCHRCFASDLQRALPHDVVVDSTGHLRPKRDGKFANAGAEDHVNHDDSSQAANIEKLERVNADLHSCLPVKITEDVPNSQPLGSTVHPSDFTIEDDSATRTFSAGIDPSKETTSHRSKTRFPATTSLPGSKRCFSTSRELREQLREEDPPSKSERSPAEVAKRAASNRKYYEANKDRLRAQGRKRYHEDLLSKPELSPAEVAERAARSRKYYEANKNHLRAQNRKRDSRTWRLNRTVARAKSRAAMRKHFADPVRRENYRAAEVRRYHNDDGGRKTNLTIRQLVRLKKHHEWAFHTPVQTLEKVSHVCSECDREQTLKLWWIRKQSPSDEYDCHKCFCKDEVNKWPIGHPQHKRPD